MIPRRLDGRRFAGRLLAGAVVGLFAGCSGGDSGEHAEWEIWDSAGIRMVENRSPAWSAGEGWTIDPDPVLQIGVVEGEEPYQLASIGTASRRADGVIAISEASSNEIRLFDPEGAHLRTIGGTGEGPGEFSTGPLVAWVHPDTLLTWDPGVRRLTWLDDRGNVLRETGRTRALTEADIRAPARVLGAWRLSADGSVLVTSSTPDQERLRLIGADGSVASFGDYSRPEGIVAGGWLVAHSFAPTPWRALRADPFAVLVARGPEREVTEFDAAGRVRALIRIHVPRLPIDDAMLQAQRDTWRERAGPEGVEAFERLALPDSLPAVLRLQVDSPGNLWIGRRTGADWGLNTEFDVVDPDGRWLGTVIVPEEIFPIYEIGDDYLLSRWTDDLDVSYLRMYRLLK